MNTQLKHTIIYSIVIGGFLLLCLSLFSLGAYLAILTPECDPLDSKTYGKYTIKRLDCPGFLDDPNYQTIQLYKRKIKIGFLGEQTDSCTFTFETKKEKQIRFNICEGKIHQ